MGVNVSAGGTKRVVIIDYDMGNLFSVAQACRHVGLDPVVSSDARVVAGAQALILPGVGAFGVAMNRLKAAGLDDGIREYVRTGRPFLGVCLGMQLLFSSSREFGDHEGLGMVNGSVVRFSPPQSELNVKVPQVGWNQIYPPAGTHEWKSDVLQGSVPGEYMYFVHSYYAVPQDANLILTETFYGGQRYCSSIVKDNIVGIQFHPEKSGRKGLQIYADWARHVD